MNQNKKRKLGKKSDFLIFGIFTILCIIAILWFGTRKTESPIAQITYQGNLVKTFVLNNTEDQIFPLMENDNVSFQIQSHKIRFYEVNCPDKICERTGFLHNSGQVAICLPNQVSLKIISSNSETDAIVL